MAKVRIQEVRRLLLPIETAVDAVVELDRSHGHTLGGATVVEARVETGSEPRLALVLQGPGTTAPFEKYYTLPAIAAAAIHYCFRARIPLPRHGAKSIEIVPEGFQLTIQTSTEVLRLHGEVPKVSTVERPPEPAAGGAGGPAIEASGDAALDDPTSATPSNSDAAPTPEAAAPESPAPAAA